MESMCIEVVIGYFPLFTEERAGFLIQRIRRVPISESKMSELQILAINLCKEFKIQPRDLWIEGRLGGFMSLKLMYDFNAENKFEGKKQIADLIDDSIRPIISKHGLDVVSISGTGFLVDSH